MSILALLLCVSPLGVMPQDPEPGEDLILLTMERLLKVKVVSATKGILEADSAPASLTVITAREIEESGARTLADLLGRIPGIVVQNELAGDRLVWVRGVTNGDNERLLLLIDGIPKRETGASAWAPDERLDLHAIERVEVIRGPGSALYGGNAYAGIVSVFTRKGPGPSRLRGEAGNQGTASLAYQHGGEANGLSWSFAARAFRSDGWPSARGRSGAPTDNRTARATRTLQAHVGATSGFSMDFIHGSHTYEYPMYDLGTKRDSTYAFTMGALVHDGRWGAWTTLARAYGDQTRYGFNSVTRNPNQTLKQEKLQNRHSLVHGFDGQASREWGGGNRFLGGVNFESNKATRLEEEWNPTDANLAKRYFINSWLSQHGEGPGYNTARTRNFALFAQHESDHFGDRLSLTGGLRWDRFEGFGNEFSPRVALVFRATNRDTFKLMGGKAFRPPTLRQLFVRRSDGKQPGNPDLQPESARTFEAEWLRRIAGGLAFRLTGFQSLYRNALLSIADGQWQNSTIPRLTRGVEAELRGEWFPAEAWLTGASAYLNGSRLLAAYEDTPLGRIPLEYVPRSTFNAGLTLRKNRMHLFTAFGWVGRRNEGRIFDPATGTVVATYHGAVTPANAAYRDQDNLGSYWTQDLSLGWRSPKGWSLELVAHNLWDRLHFNPPFDPDNYYDVTRERRSVQLRVGLRK